MPAPRILIHILFFFPSASTLPPRVMLLGPDVAVSPYFVGASRWSVPEVADPEIALVLVVLPFVLLPCCLPTTAGGPTGLGIRLWVCTQGAGRKREAYRDQHAGDQH